MHNVLVFPSCNEPGLEIVEALRKHPKVKVFGASSYALEDDPSRLVLREHHELPPLGDAKFRKAMVAFTKKHDIHFVFPTTDALMAEMSAWEDPAVPVVGPNPTVAELLLSKRRTLMALYSVLKTARKFREDIMELPCFAKPDVGSGSRGAHVVHTDDELVVARSRPGTIFQEVLPGPEYTVDCVGDRDGKLLFCQVRCRTSVARGIAVGSEQVDHPQIQTWIRLAGQTLPIAGPWFAQFKEDADGVPRLLEVNARVGGSMGLTRLSGVNIPLIALFSFAGHPIRVPQPLHGVRVVRSLNRRGNVDDFDWVIWDLDDTLVRKDGKADPETIAWLYELENQDRRQLLVSKNPDPTGTIERLRIPNVFVDVRRADDKVATVAALLAAHDIETARCILINDSTLEKLAFEDAFPALRTIAPDAIDVLHRETVG